ncbi:phosphoribosylformylglycinamidine synthase subunit PurQ [Pigmentibacter ruber]|uniref:phosphoribosylformylglycinamidine synthase subunit PurQ n=1 Tax=Pigmentibacter ruber TaxID=2683196 RepID=UPI00131DF92F|nr:phosphoribosylformylglycinamidine synthase subunit PurQ [Pigmentibacter ruber]
MKKKTLVPVFPGTNCEKESLLWIANNLETNAEYLDLERHSHLKKDDIDFIFIPGGFSFGDYLRAGALAARTKEMAFVKEKALENIPILGICNGFQILCESGLLPGALIKNITRQHHHFPVSIRIDTCFLDESNQAKKSLWIPKFRGQALENVNRIFGKEIFIPMSCGMGNWLPPSAEKDKNLAEKNAVVYYNFNENGSYKSIAGLTNESGTIFGMMPHPERASEEILGGNEGLIFLLGISQTKNIAIKQGSPLALFVEQLTQGENYV